MVVEEFLPNAKGLFDTTRFWCSGENVLKAYEAMEKGGRPKSTHAQEIWRRINAGL
jgi:hypothetical protein